MKLKVAVFSTITYWGEEEYKNLDQAVKYVDEAASAGAKLICFPEGYPGPCHGPMPDPRQSQEPVAVMCEQARKHGLYISMGNVESVDGVDGAYYLTHKLIGPDGRLLANYKRVQPDHPQLNSWLMNGRRHILPGDEIITVPTEIGRIGLMICSELWVPEISRIQMLQGAQIIIAPVSGAPSRSKFILKDTWHCIARARSAENQLYVLIAENVFVTPEGHSKLGVACIAGPEEMLAVSSAPGPVYSELDLDRLAWLRTRYVESDLLAAPDDPSNFDPVRTRTGQIHDRRPELYGPLVQAQADAFNYHYYRGGLESVSVEYEKVRRHPLPVTGEHVEPSRKSANA